MLVDQGGGQVVWCNRVQRFLAQLESARAPNANILASKLFNYFHLALADVTAHKNFVLSGGMVSMGKVCVAHGSRLHWITPLRTVSNLKLTSIVLTEVERVFEY